jgi:hypothetical protein
MRQTDSCKTWDKSSQSLKDSKGVDRGSDVFTPRKCQKRLHALFEHINLLKVPVGGWKLLWRNFRVWNKILEASDVDF